MTLYQKIRLIYIDWRIEVYGRVTRRDFAQDFGQNSVTSSNDFKEFRLLFPGNIEYDSTLKYYRRCDGAERVFTLAQHAAVRELVGTVVPLNLNQLSRNYIRDYPTDN